MSSSPFSSSPSNLFSAPSPFAPETSREEEPVIAVSRPALDATEVETAAAAIEVIVRWGGDILHIEHMERPKSFSVGDDGDFALPSDKLGMSRAQIVSVEGGRACAVVPAGMSAKVSRSGRALSLADAVVEGLASRKADGSHEVPMVHGIRVKIEAAAFELEVASVHAGRKVAGKVGADKRAFGGQALSFAIHGAIAAAMLAFMPGLASTDESSAGQDQSYMLQMLLKAEATQDRIEEEATLSNEAPAQAEAMAPKGGPESKESSKMGSSTAKPANKRHAISTDDKERALDRAAAIRDAQNFGMVELLGTLSSASPDALSAPWGKTASGPDAENANGLMWADEIGDAFGNDGLDLSGTGENSGGPFKGNYLGDLDTGGFSNGTCVGPLCGGISGGYLPSSHKVRDVKPPRPGPTTITGRIAPEVIQRVVRSNFGRFRGCYEAGLRTNPNLAGRVAVAFTVGRDGAVGMVGNAGSDLPDAGVVACVVKQFYGLSFPAPEDGIVKVTYPIIFNPN
ncbi:MAG: AgmX/PglI C-terminal domain-containing protein [Polyangiaceae bacterium]|jgi:hypothetical protein|nr:AgmX/PglI C-terminal domain-containing protein [Polyangiaceae bacterium]